MEEEIRHQIQPPDEKAMEAGKAHWDAIAKPLHGLGKLEDLVIQIAGIRGNAQVELQKRALLVCCSDNGVVEEGISQSGMEVTALVAQSLFEHKTSACLMARAAGCDVFSYDVGIAVDTPLPKRKVACGTGNIAKGPAMSRQQAESIVREGMKIAEEKKKEGYDILVTGEMGIGNTTTSAAVASVLLGKDPKEVAGKGAGLSDEGLRHKIEVIRQAISCNRPEAEDPIDVLCKLGGYDIAAMTGIFLGGAIQRIPVVIDGFISAVAADLAVRIAPQTASYILASHVSGERGAAMVLADLNKEACLDCGMALGEGTGGVALLPLLDMALAVYQGSNSFADLSMDPYQPQ